MIGGQGEDSWGKSGTNETPQEPMRRGGLSAARRKRSLARKSTAVKQAVQIIYSYYSSLNGGELGMFQSLMYEERNSYF
ncbi:hypothetical protein [Priestia megaterium]|uniref:hypothetical protein n=1 Tax=Priestia megaterium TaxID=1404 RepID=UPI002E1F2480|nr:hypothetical protein [Priestia megaterium]